MAVETYRITKGHQTGANRSPFAMQKTVFYKLKDGLSETLPPSVS